MLPARVGTVGGRGQPSTAPLCTPMDVEGPGSRFGETRPDAEPSCPFSPPVLRVQPGAVTVRPPTRDKEEKLCPGLEEVASETLPRVVMRAGTGDAVVASLGSRGKAYRMPVHGRLGSVRQASVQDFVSPRPLVPRLGRGLPASGEPLSRPPWRSRVSRFLHVAFGLAGPAVTFTGAVVWLSAPVTCKRELGPVVRSGRG